MLQSFNITTEVLNTLQEEPNKTFAVIMNCTNETIITHFIITTDNQAFVTSEQLSDYPLEPIQAYCLGNNKQPSAIPINTSRDYKKEAHIIDCTSYLKNLKIIYADKDITPRAYEQLEVLLTN